MATTSAASSAPPASQTSIEHHQSPSIWKFVSQTNTAAANTDHVYLASNYYVASGANVHTAIPVAACDSTGKVVKTLINGKTNPLPFKKLVISRQPFGVNNGSIINGSKNDICLVKSDLLLNGGGGGGGGSTVDSLSVCSDVWTTVSSVGGSSISSNGGTSNASVGVLSDRLTSLVHSQFGSADEFDEDSSSNDTRASCSSSSGGSSSSNSMVGSVSRHLSMNNPAPRIQHTPITVTAAVASGSGKITISNSSQYKDTLTPKQVKRRLEWDSTPDTPVKTTMTAVNGKPVSVRTFKLSNAMKQSLVAAGCTKAVAMAAISAIQNDGNNSLDNATSGGVNPLGSLVSHQQPTAIAIVNGPSSKSPLPTVQTIITSPAATINGGGGCTPLKNCAPQQVIFKTPLTPKSSTGVSAATLVANVNSPQVTTILVNDKGEQLSLSKSNGAIRFTPISTKGAGANVASPVLSPVLATSAIVTNSGNGTATSPNIKQVNNGNIVIVNGTNGVKRLRTVKGSDSPLLTTPTNCNFAKVGVNTPKQNGASRSRNDSTSSDHHLESPVPFSSPFDYSSDSGGLYNGGGSSLGDMSSPVSSPTPEGRGGRKSSAGSRQETSLGTLTRKFIDLMEQSAQGSINLNTASEILGVQKRRIYDITNVLEGVGLLHKTSKNNIQWRGGLWDYRAGKLPQNPDQPTHYKNRKPPPLSLLFGDAKSSNLDDPFYSTDKSKEQLQQELFELENDENRLDNLLSVAEAQVASLRANASQSLYVNYKDLRRVPEFTHQTVIGIRPPSDTTLEVPDPKECLQIYLKNSNGKMIEVYLCPQMSEFEEQQQQQMVQQSTVHRLQSQNQEQQQVLSSNCTPLTVKNESQERFGSAISGPASNQNIAVVKQELLQSDSGITSSFGTSSALGTTVPNSNNGHCLPHSEGHFSPPSLPDAGLDSLMSSSSAFDDFHCTSVQSHSSTTGFHARNVFISDDDEYGPFGSNSYLAQTEDQSLEISPAHHETVSMAHHNHGQHHTQHLSAVQSGLPPPSDNSTTSVHHHGTLMASLSPSVFPLIPLNPPIDEEDYNFTLRDNEGIVDLFDDSDFVFDIEG